MSFLQRNNIVNAQRALAIALCCMSLVGMSAPQTTRRKSKPPRALALVEWPASGSGTVRVIPVCILVDGRYYDAGIYMADPVPLALDPGTVYEVEQSGDPIGFAIVSDAQQPQGGRWFAGARFRAKNAVAASTRKTEPAVRAEVEEGPPRLHKGEARKGTEPAPQATPAPSQAPPGEGPPVLRQPSSTTQATAQKAPPPSAPESRAREDEPDRPKLRRGKTAVEQAESLPGSVSIPTGARTSTTSIAQPKGMPAAKSAPVRVLAAISDAGGPEPKPYLFQWSPQEQTKLTSGMQELATAALQKYAVARQGSRPGKLENVEVRAFDLAYDNEPQLVLTAMARGIAAAPARAARMGARAQRVTPEPQAPSGSAESPTYWITLVAREDLSGDLRQLESWVTDNTHLDVFPRRELIDAVDADGDGRGELLFRLVSDRGRNFALYRVRSDQVIELYNGGELEQ